MTNPLPCGCRIIHDYYLSIEFCPLHAAAPKMLTACKIALYHIDLTGDGVSSAEHNAKVALRTAIAAAEPVSKEVE